MCFQALVAGRLLRDGIGDLDSGGPGLDLADLGQRQLHPDLLPDVRVRHQYHHVCIYHHHLLF